MVLTPQGLRFLGRVIPCSIGRAGITPAKREGDHATPSGRHRITGLWYRPDRLARPAPWARVIGPGDLWCDAPGHAAYNRHARAPLAVQVQVLDQEPLDRAGREPLVPEGDVDGPQPFQIAGEGAARLGARALRPVHIDRQADDKS